jgi:hypothetical protein
MSTHADHQTHDIQEIHIHIFVNRRKIPIEDPTVTGAQLLDLADFEGTQWDLLQLQGEGDPSGGTVILADQQLTLHNADRFRVVPGNRTFGGR